MFRPATVPQVRAPAPSRTRHRPRHQPLVRRDPRRFARGLAKMAETPRPARTAMSADLRFFAHSFGGAFLFVSLFIA